jgi:hypothetical protein
MRQLLIQLVHMPTVVFMPAPLGDLNSSLAATTMTLLVESRARPVRPAEGKELLHRTLQRVAVPSCIFERKLL